MVEWQKQNYLPQSTLPSFFSNKSLASFLGMSWPRAYLSQALWQLGWPVRHRWKLLGGTSGKTFWPALFFLLHPNRNEGMMAGAAETTLCLWKWKTCAEYRRTERKSIVFWYTSIVYIIYMYSTHTYYMILIYNILLSTMLTFLASNSFNMGQSSMSLVSLVLASSLIWFLIRFL